MTSQPRSLCGTIIDVLAAFDTASVDIKPTLLSMKEEARKCGLAKQLECQRLADGWMRGPRASQIEDAKHGDEKTERIRISSSYPRHTSFGQSGALENVGLRETKIGLAATAAVGSFS